MIKGFSVIKTCLYKPFFRSLMVFVIIAGVGLCDDDLEFVEPDILRVGKNSSYNLIVGANYSQPNNNYEFWDKEKKTLTIKDPSTNHEIEIDGTTKQYKYIELFYNSIQIDEGYTLVCEGFESGFAQSINIYSTESFSNKGTIDLNLHSALHLLCRSDNYGDIYTTAESNDHSRIFVKGDGSLKCYDKSGIISRGNYAATSLFVDKQSDIDLSDVKDLSKFSGMWRIYGSINWPSSAPTAKSGLTISLNKEFGEYIPYIDNDFIMVHNEEIDKLNETLGYKTQNYFRVLGNNQIIGETSLTAIVNNTDLNKPGYILDISQSWLNPIIERPISIEFDILIPNGFGMIWDKGLKGNGRIIVDKGGTFDGQGAILTKVIINKGSLVL